MFTRERTSLRLLGGADVDGPQGASLDDPATTVNETINRDALSLDLSGVDADFVPDIIFAFDASDEPKAAAFMKAHGLQSGQFIPEDSFKADMFRDIGLGHWLIAYINQASGADVSAALLRIVSNPAEAKAHLRAAMGQVADRHAFGVRVLRRTLGLAPH